MHKTFKLSIITSLVTLTMQLSACNDSGFTSSSGSSRSSTTSTATIDKTNENNPTTEEKQKRLETGVDSLENGRIKQAFLAASSTRSQMVDVVFAVDTSASMAE